MEGIVTVLMLVVVVAGAVVTVIAIFVATVMVLSEISYRAGSKMKERVENSNAYVREKGNEIAYIGQTGRRKREEIKREERLHEKK